MITFYISIFVILVLIYIIIFEEKEYSCPKSVCPECICPEYKNNECSDSVKKKIKDLITNNIIVSFRGPLVFFSRDLITIKEKKLYLIKYNPEKYEEFDDNVINENNIWYYDKYTRKLKHLSSGFYIKIDNFENITVIPEYSDASNFINTINSATLQHAETLKYISLGDQNEIKLIENGHDGTKSLFFMERFCKYSIDNNNWYNVTELISNFTN
jgi:hypothetical protein